MDQIRAYMEKHKIEELFNEIMTRILDERPQDAKFHIIELLKSAKLSADKDPFSRRSYKFLDQNGEVDSYLTKEDFESIFDSYDVLNIQAVPLAYLAQALQVVGVENPQEVLTSRYAELCKEEYVNKVSFVFVLQEEHNRLGYSFKNRH